jgi:hypothetical protein
MIRTCVARKRGVDGPEGRRQAYMDVFTASSGTSWVSPELIIFKASPQSKLR